MNRTPAVAGQFYPADHHALRNTIADFIPETSVKQENAIAVISPHAGYIFSGAVAAETFAEVSIPETVIVLGPNHHGIGEALAVMDSGSWQMPMGTVYIDEDLAKKILDSSHLFTSDTLAHLREHSLEVQIPFLQYFVNNLHIVPICISSISYDECNLAGKALAATIKSFNKPVLMVASTDMTHYESREAASQKDKMALECVEKMDPEALYKTVVGNRISMCGIIPTTIALVAAKHLGAQSAKLIRYTDSGAVNGDTSQVVGYAGFVVT